VQGKTWSVSAFVAVVVVVRRKKESKGERGVNMITRAASVKQLRSSVAKSPPKRAPLKEINLQEERTPAGKVREKKKKEEATEVAVAAEIVQPGGPGARTSSSEFEGWTMEQYADLQRAYAMVRPGPSFWQEVARQVQISISLHRSV
jgi:hypothetical protein